MSQCFPSPSLATQYPKLSAPAITDPNQKWISIPSKLSAKCHVPLVRSAQASCHIETQLDHRNRGHAVATDGDLLDLILPERSERYHGVTCVEVGHGVK